MCVCDNSIGSHENRLSKMYIMCEVHNGSHWLNAIVNVNGVPHGKMFASHKFKVFKLEDHMDHHIHNGHNQYMVHSVI